MQLFRYLSDDSPNPLLVVPGVDQKRFEFVIGVGGNDDFYLGIVPEGETPREMVRVTISGGVEHTNPEFLTGLRIMYSAMRAFGSDIPVGIEPNAVTGATGWRPIYFSPVIEAEERVCVGIAAVNGPSNDARVRVLNRPGLFQSMYGVSKGTEYQTIVQTNCTRLREILADPAEGGFFNLDFDVVDFDLPFDGMCLGKLHIVRDGDLYHAIENGLRQCCPLDLHYQ